MPTIPQGSGPEITFISGVTETLTVAATAGATWQNDSNPATWTTQYSREGKWGDTKIGTPGGNVTYWFDPASNWTSDEQEAFSSGLALWSAMANITFSAVSDQESAGIRFVRQAGGAATFRYTDPAAAIDSHDAGKIAWAKITINTTAFPIGTSFQANTASGYLGWQTVIHEEGHALGLDHAGPYNGVVNPFSQQFGPYDTQTWSTMSYIKAWGKYQNEYPIPVNETFWTGPPTTPMILDILAIQRVYGAATSGPLASGGQVFGFNSNIDGPIRKFFDFTVNKAPVITIWDGGTNNTLDLSGFASGSTVDLKPGGFSSAGGSGDLALRKNIAIAMDTIIEKAIGGPGNDTFLGSNAANTFTGNGGDDTIDGGDGTDTAIFSGRRSQYTLTAADGGGVQVVGPDGTDILKNVERLKFDDQTVDWPLNGADADSLANTVADQARPFGAAPVGNPAAGNLETATDRDWFGVQLIENTAYTISLLGLQGGGGTLSNPYLRLHDPAGSTVAENDDIVPGANLDSRITFVPTVTGVYYIEAGAHGDNLTGTYQLLVSSPASLSDDLADALNDATHPLGALSAGGSSHGNLEVPTDRDWFALQFTAGESYTIRLTGAPDGDGKLADAYLRLHDGSGAVVGENDDADGTTGDSELAFLALSTGTYYVEAGSYQDRYAGTYTVSLAVSSRIDDYADFLADSSHSPGSVAIGGSALGNIEVVGDHDWFSVHLEAGTRYGIDVRGMPGGGGSLPDTSLVVHDGTGHTLAENDDAEAGVDFDSTLDFIAAVSGTYYVEAMSFADRFSGSYTVQVVAGSRVVADAITQLYAAYCDRAPDAAGEAYWVDRLHAGMTIGEIAKSFAGQQESRDLYGYLATLDATDSSAIRAFVGEIYANLFDRVPDAAGEAYWMAQVSSGSDRGTSVILDIISGARGHDVVTIDNKVAVGNYFVAQTFNNQVPMTLAVAREALNGLGSTAADVEAGKAAVDSFISAALDQELSLVGVASASGSH
ncbi:MAG: pre-peptidase C-terminal domain-containing protein [Reyranellaceae bacterium]